MKSLSISGDNRMTVKEVADALGYEPRTIQLKVKELFPELVTERQATYLDEYQVTAIKKACEKKFAAVTELEMKQKAAEVIGWLASETDRLRIALAAAAPKVESHDALMRCESTMSVTDAAKHFGLHPRTQVFPYLRDSGYLTLADLPTQAAIDAGYLVLKEVKCQGDVIRPQAAVEVRQLEIWRTRILPQIKRWESKGATE